MQSQHHHHQNPTKTEKSQDQFPEEYFHWEKQKETLNWCPLGTC